MLSLKSKYGLATVKSRASGARSRESSERASFWQTGSKSLKPELLVPMWHLRCFRLE